MIYIYNCYGGTHTSSLASEIHLNRLPTGRLPTREEILNAEYFNKLTNKDRGKFIFRGVDDEGNKVYTLGRGMSKTIVPCVENLLKLLHDECGVDCKFVLSNTSPTVPPLMAMGGFFSRGLRIDFIGVPLLVAGAKQAYSRIIEVVARTKEKAHTFDGRILIMDNKDKQI